MAIIHPCRHCPKRPTCPLRAETAAALSGSMLRVTVARVSCKIYEEMFTPGDRVAAKLKRSHFYVPIIVHGTIVGKSAARRGKWTVQVDPDDVDKTGLLQNGYEDIGHRPFISLYPNRMTRMPEPPRAICHLCGNAKAADGSHLDPKGNGECDGVRVKVYGWGDCG